MSGVSKVETDPQNHTAIVTFNDEKVTVDALKKALSDGGFTPAGEPQFTKPSSTPR